jgi:aryl-alcohol dehydrogenase-like predicted oxidoreductase
MINRRPLGTLGITVSEVSFGGAAISGEGRGYGFGHIGDDEAAQLLAACFDRGINLFDTAPVYGFGLSEKRIGKAFHLHRDRVIIVSKGGIVWDDRKRIKIDNHPKVMQKMLEQSLKDLQTDYIDLYMIHWPDRNIDIRRPMEYLSRAKQEGKIRSIGLCNAGREDINSAAEIDTVDVVQNECNLFNSAAFYDIRDLLRKMNAGFLSWGTLDKGILTGRVTPERTFDDADARSWAPWWKHEDRTPKYRAMEKIAALLRETGHSPLEMALGYVLQFAEVSAVLCGIRNTGQLATALDALAHLPQKGILEEARTIADQTLQHYHDEKEKGEQR